MRKRTIMPSGDIKGLAKSLMNLVKGNPIAEEISPIKKDKDPVGVISELLARPNQGDNKRIQGLSKTTIS